MRSRSAPFPVLFFASAAHGMHHVLLTLFLTLVLVIAPQWHLPYNDLVALWTLGAMLVGLGAPFAGWLADRIGETKVLVLCFLGLGTSAVLCGLAQNTMQLEGALALLGLSGSIYHPVGFSWVVKHARQRGRAIAIAGVAGSIGVAAGPVIAGGLATLAGWRTAFIVPGVVTLSIGALLLAIHLMGRIVDRAEDHAPVAHNPSRADITRTFTVMALTMTITLIVNSAFGTALPKLVELSHMAGTRGLFAIGLIAGTIQLAGASAQFVGGHFADRGAAKRAYITGFIALAAIFPVLAYSTGWGVAVAAIAVVVVFESIAPVETMFLARYTPAARRGLVFGVRYGLATIGTPAGVWLVARLYNVQAHFLYLLISLAALAALAMFAALALPSDRKHAMMPAE